MSTFFDPATIRRLAAEGDHFYMGAAWILDQQDAARIDTTDYDSEWKRNVVAVNPHSEEFRRLKHAPADTSVVDSFTGREHVTARSLGLPYPTRLDVEPR